MSLEADLAGVCRRLGAAPPQDRLMARKLLQRSRQLALERGVNEVEALRHLLNLLYSAQQAGAPPDSALSEGSDRTMPPDFFPDDQENR